MAKGRIQLPVIDQDAFNLFDYPNLTGTPERNLLMAVLERAILDFVGNSEKELLEAEQWLFEEVGEPPYEIFSFGWVCNQLDLDANQIAETVERMPKRGHHRTAPWYFLRAG